jgi:hypothetical protein
MANEITWRDQEKKVDAALDRGELMMGGGNNMKADLNKPS